jgi:hypothetical protein
MLPKEKGPCMNYEQRFYFDTSLGRCEEFTYGGKYFFLLIKRIHNFAYILIKHEDVTEQEIISNR